MIAKEALKNLRSERYAETRKMALFIKKRVKLIEKCIGKSNGYVFMYMNETRNSDRDAIIHNSRVQMN
jgi:uncharacterized protein YicC (UPF0701 family)